MERQDRSLNTIAADASWQFPKVRTQSGRLRSQRSNLSSSKLPIVSRRTGCRRHITVEALPGGMQTTVIWAPDRVPLTSDEFYPYTPTERVHIDPREAKQNSSEDLVFQTDSFDIRVEGMCTEPLDPRIPIIGQQNEVVLYSLEMDDEPGSEGGDDAHSVPKVHYNHTSDSAVKPDQYVAIPDSRSLVLYSPAEEVRRHVNLRFKIMEMDTVDASVREAIERISKLSTNLNTVTTTMPFLTVLSPAIGMAGEVGRRALDSYAKPDKVVSVDFDMRIAPSDQEELHRCRPGDYMRYGYMFFLSKPVRARLFASISTSRNVVLMMRVVSGASDGSGAYQYVPLTKVSYLVVRVGKPFGDESIDSKKTGRLTVGAVRRLQSIVESAEDLPPQQLKNDLVDVIKQVRKPRQ